MGISDDYVPLCPTCGDPVTSGCYPTDGICALEGDERDDSAEGDTVASLRATLAQAEANGWVGWVCCEHHDNRPNGLPCDGSCCDECPGLMVSAGHPAAWTVPKIRHDENADVGPHIIGAWIFRSAGQSDVEHTRRYAAQLLAAADELEQRLTGGER